MRIGIISDTHGLLRPEVIESLDLTHPGVTADGIMTKMGY